MKENKPPVAFAKVDATVESDLAQKHEVSGYPTLKIFRKGMAYEYDGPRDEEGMSFFLYSLGKEISQISTSLKSKTPLSIIGSYVKIFLSINLQWAVVLWAAARA